MEIVPSKQNINELFATTSFHIDFYQREYKWDSGTVKQLLDDLFYTFDLAYPLNTSLDPNLSNISAKYPWYYLNTYITNKTHGQIFIVDGQQRLTTITLILIALHALCPQFDSPALKSWLHAKIAGVGVGGVTQFWMADEKRRSVMDALLRDDVAAARQTPGITARYMTQNFELVDAELRNRLDTRHRFQSFVYYFLCMVVIVNLDVPQTDVSMVFEVINDRGIGLQPYEIFKGKLLAR